MLIDPGHLLTKHRYLLEEDLHNLGSSYSGVQKKWVCSVEEEIKASDHVKLGKHY